MIGEVRGRGLLLGMEFVADRATRRPFAGSQRVTDRIVGGMRDRGVLITAGVALANHGKDGDHVQISPPFTIAESECRLIVDALDETLGAVARDLEAGR
jgi:4-aminobutyrate aminotransferase-like enzyme